MPKRILVIDDHPNVVRSIQVNLEREGYEVCSAHEGVTGLDLARRGRPDLIILDVMMPGLDGRAVLRELKVDPDTATIPVLILTVLNDAHEVAFSLDLGAQWHLPKPFNVHELLAIVKRLLEVEQYCPSA